MSSPVNWNGIEVVCHTSQLRIKVGQVVTLFVEDAAGGRPVQIEVRSHPENGVEVYSDRAKMSGFDKWYSGSQEA